MPTKFVYRLFTKYHHKNWIYCPLFVSQDNIEALWIIFMPYDYSKINSNVVIETNQLHGLPIKMYIEYSAH